MEMQRPEDMSDEDWREYIEGIVEEAEQKRKALGQTRNEYFEHCLARVKAATKQRQDPEAERGTLGCILLAGEAALEMSGVRGVFNHKKERNK